MSKLRLNHDLICSNKKLSNLEIVEQQREKELQMKRIIKILSGKEFTQDSYLDDFIAVNNMW